ncbi:hypothetical protein AB2N04_13250 [Nitratireductor sp. GISD-1A_MAKvit]|uniref:hypothetical protein n=1 Tax=Nitratireductor sp. GISD-1A_MAKvit TaxID=3234198 RepID=UPI0034657084
MAKIVDISNDFFVIVSASVNEVFARQALAHETRPRHFPQKQTVGSRIGKPSVSMEFWQ